MAIAFAALSGIGNGWEQSLGDLVIQLGCPDEYMYVLRLGCDESALSINLVEYGPETTLKCR